MRGKVLGVISVPDSTRIRSAIARPESQLIPWKMNAAARCAGITRSWRKSQSFGTDRIGGDDELIARQCLVTDDLAQVVRKMFER